MKRICFIVWICVMTLTGCRMLPTPREMGDMALLRTVGVDPQGDGISLTVSTGLQAKGTQGEQGAALCLTVDGTSLSAAAMALQGLSEKYVFFGYVDQLLLGEEQVKEGVNSVLSWFASDVALSLGANTWVIRGDTAQTAVVSGGEQGIDLRLENFRQDAALGIAPMTRTAEEIYIAIEETGCAYVPTLSMKDDGLHTGSYAILRNGILVGYLDGIAARGLELLAEHPMAEILEVELPEQQVSLRVTSSQIECVPIFVSKGLEGIQITCQVDVEFAQQEKAMTKEEREQVQVAVQRQLNERLQAALQQLVLWGTDCTALGSRISLEVPWYWHTMQHQWLELFSQMTPTTQVTVTLGIGRR